MRWRPENKYVTAACAVCGSTFNYLTVLLRENPESHELEPWYHCENCVDTHIEESSALMRLLELERHGLSRRHAQTPPLEALIPTLPYEYQLAALHLLELAYSGGTVFFYGSDDEYQQRLLHSFAMTLWDESDWSGLSIYSGRDLLQTLFDRARAAEANRLLSAPILQINLAQVSFREQGRIFQNLSVARRLNSTSDILLLVSSHSPETTRDRILVGLKEDGNDAARAFIQLVGSSCLSPFGTLHGITHNSETEKEIQWQDRS